MEKYHLEDKEPTEVTLPSIMKNSSASSIEFFKDTKAKNLILIEKIEVFLFEKDIAILTINYKIPDNLTDDEYLSPP